MAAIAVRSVASAGVNGTAVVINKPTGTASGDVLVAFVGARNSSSVTCTAPAGWTSITSQARGSLGKAFAFYRVADGSEGSTFTFTLSISEAHSGGILALTGVDTANPINVSTTASSGTSSSPHPCPDATTTVDRCLLVRMAMMSRASTGSYTWSGATEQFDVTGTNGSSRQITSVATETTLAAGAVGVRNATPSSSASYATITVAVTPVDTTPVDPNKLLWVYGHSFTQDPGVSCTPGQEFYKLVEAQSSNYDYVTTYGVGSSRAVDVAQDVVNQAARTPMGGSTWDGTRSGAIILDCLFNDAYNTTSAAPSTAGALSSTQQSNLTASLATILAVLSSSGRVECETGTKGGTWLADSSATRYSGGAVARCNSNGGTLTVNVTVPAAGYVWLLHYGVSSSQAGQFTVTEGATTYATVTAADQNVASVYSKRATAADEVVLPFITKITASAGAHSFVITKTNNDGLTIYPDCFLLPASSPLKLVVLRDPMTTSNDGTGSWNASGNPTNFSTTSANLALVNTCLDNAITLVGHPNLTVVDPALNDAARTPDGLHPNDTGMQTMATAVIAALGGESTGGQINRMLMGVG